MSTFHLLMYYDEGDFQMQIEVPSEMNFQELDQFVRKQLDFDSSGMSAFIPCNNKWEEKDIMIFPQKLDADESVTTFIMEETPLSQFFTRKGEKFVYLFDVLNNRVLHTEVIAINQGSNLTAPRLISSEGLAPLQEEDPAEALQALLADMLTEDGMDDPELLQSFLNESGYDVNLSDYINEIDDDYDEIDDDSSRY